MNRRQFLKNTTLATTALWLPQFLHASDLRPSSTHRKLIIIQLNGGNDGLNTIVPHYNDIYYRERNTLALRDEELLKINDEVAFNASLKGLRSLYDRGFVSIVQNVGYPNPDRSHFISSDIWHSASRESSRMHTGWIGRYLDSQCQSCEPYACLELDDTISLAVKGEKHTAFALGKEASLRKINQNLFLTQLDSTHQSGAHEEVEYLYKTLADTKLSANYLLEKMNQSATEMSALYPQHEFGRDLKTIATLIQADANTQIYYASLSGFDTHVFQKGQQNRMLQIYDSAVSALAEDLVKSGHWQDTLIFTFSEFGRRVAQNKSQGTDHGTANCCFLLGGKLKQSGLYNASPDLQNLIDGDLQYELDFRHIYADILESWLSTTQHNILFDVYEKTQII